MYRGPNGVQQWEGKFKRETDASERLKAVLHEIDTGMFVARSAMTFENFAERWLASRRSILGSTESGYASNINAQLIPRIGSVR
jgi:hypothetical protein